MMRPPMMRAMITAAALLAFGVAPALATSCCGGGKGKTGMCARDGMKAGMAMNHGSMKKKGGCCCEGMAGNMSKRG